MLTRKKYLRLLNVKTCWTTLVSIRTTARVEPHVDFEAASLFIYPTELYCKLDTMLLCCAFLQFKMEVKNEFDLECTHYISLPQANSIDLY